MSETTKILLTKEMVVAARDYIPNAVKEAWVSDNAAKCFDKLAINGTDGESVPPMYMLNTGLKARYLMGALIGMYLNITYDVDSSDEPSLLMSEDAYDMWASSHVLNQIERWKRDAEIRDKCYDLLADYKDLEKRMSTQINSLLNVMNDNVLRQNEYVNAQMMEQLPALLKQVEELQARKGEANAD